MSLILAGQKIGGVLVIDADGPITRGVGSVSLGTAIELAVSRGEKKILLDMTKTPYADDFCLELLKNKLTIWAKQGTSLKLFTPIENKNMGRLLSATKMCNLFEIFTDKETAIRSFE